MATLRSAAVRLLLALGVASWIAVIWFHAGSDEFSIWYSDLALCAVALGAGGSCIITGLRNRGRYRLVWLLLGASTMSWGLGQVVWTYYEALRGEEVPFPSFADLGYLAAVPLAAVAMMLLPSGTRSMAGRARMVLDGLVVAASFFLISWIIVLGKVFHANAGGILEQFLSLCYPLGDVVIVTIVVYAMLRARATGRKIPLALGLVALGLVFWSIADSGFTYLTAIDAYGSGNPIDTGWFAGFLLIMLAARTRGALEQAGEGDSSMPRSMGLLLPYVAVVMALATSIFDFTRNTIVDPFVSWDRSALIALLVGRQILTLRENMSLTRDLQARVVEVQSSEQRFESLVQQSSDVVTVVDRAGIVIYQSETISRVFGYTVESMTGQPIDRILSEGAAAPLAEALRRAAESPASTVVIEVPVLHTAGHVCDAEISLTNLLDDPNVGGLVLNLRDVSERRALERALVHQASHDSLTELANRSLFRQRIDNALAAAPADTYRGAVLFLDLDGFKELNDSLGHAAGDLLLTQVAARLQSCVRPSDTVARLGGDEFGVLVSGEENEVDPHSLAARILSSFRTPFAIEGHEIQVRTSIGIAHADPEVEGSDQLLRNADLAMYRAKTGGGGTIERYDPSMHAQLLNRLQLEVDLRRALGRGELRLHYQPLVDLRTGQPVGLEALLRWQHPTYGLISPDKFIGVAEQTGLIQPIGRWVLHEACRQTAAWRRRHPTYDELSISVNISARQFANDDLLYDVMNALEESALPADHLELEMTESVLFEHTDENVAQMQRLKALGVRLAIDDFGTGYSSLAYLHMFAVDVLKIDRTFVAQLTDANPDVELIRTILKIGQSLGMLTIAEGIETDFQLASVRDLGCELGQGYLFAKPLPPSEVDSWLDAQEAKLPTEARATPQVAIPPSRTAS